MICKDIEIEIPKEAPFTNDRLNRGPIANNLTSLSNLFSDSGAVISLDGEWGAGKTTFVKMWKQQLINDGYRCIYFNAWECDFQEDPFVAIMSELYNSFDSTENFKEVITSGTKILTKISGEILKEIVRKWTGIDTNVIATATDEITDQCIEKINDYNEHKATLSEFKEKLAEFVASDYKGKPVIFFIDELDRCNPHFALKLLERIKHLFDVPNIIFVLAVNINQLQYSIQGFYGSSLINEKEYLKRFFDIEYTLPEPNLENYCDFLYESYGLKDFFECSQRTFDFTLKDSKILFLDIAKTLLAESHLSLRKSNRLFSMTRLALTSFGVKSKFAPDVLFLLCYLKEIKPSLYSAIKYNQFSIQDLLYKLETNLPNSLFNNNDMFIQHRITYTIASLICKYNHPDGRIDKEPGFKNTSEDTDKNPIFPIKCDKLDLSHLNKALEYYSNEMSPGYSLKSIFESIEFANHIQINL